MWGLFLLSSKASRPCPTNLCPLLWEQGLFLPCNSSSAPAHSSLFLPQPARFQSSGDPSRSEPPCCSGHRKQPGTSGAEWKQVSERGHSDLQRLTNTGKWLKVAARGTRARQREELAKQLIKCPGFWDSTFRLRGIFCLPFSLIQHALSCSKAEQ